MVLVAKEVYKGGKQYENITELKIAIIESWKLVTTRVINKLVISMQTRMKERLRANEYAFDY